MAKLTSRVPDTWLALYQRLAAETWPTISGVDPIAIVFGTSDKPLKEAVVVVGTPPTSSTLDLATNLSEDELFVLQVRIVTELENRTVGQVFARVKELGDVVQNSLRDPTTGRISNAFNGASPTHPVEGIVSWRVSQYRSQMYVTTAGPSGVAELDVLFKARI